MTHFPYSCVVRAGAKSASMRRPRPCSDAYTFTVGISMELDLRAALAAAMVAWASTPLSAHTTRSPSAVDASMGWACRPSGRATPAAGWDGTTRGTTELTSWSRAVSAVTRDLTSPVIGAAAVGERGVWRIPRYPRSWMVASARCSPFRVSVLATGWLELPRWRRVGDHPAMGSLPAAAASSAGGSIAAPRVGPRSPRHLRRRHHRSRCGAGTSGGRGHGARPSPVGGPTSSVWEAETPRTRGLDSVARRDCARKRSGSRG